MLTQNQLTPVYFNPEISPSPKVKTTSDTPNSAVFLKFTKPSGKWKTMSMPSHIIIESYFRFAAEKFHPQQDYWISPLFPWTALNFSPFLPRANNILADRPYLRNQSWHFHFGDERRKKKSLSSSWHHCRWAANKANVFILISVRGGDFRHWRRLRLDRVSVVAQARSGNTCQTGKCDEGVDSKKKIGWKL